MGTGRWGFISSASSAILLKYYTSDTSDRTCVLARETGSCTRVWLAWVCGEESAHSWLQFCDYFGNVTWRAEESSLFAVFVNGHRKMGILSRTVRNSRTLGIKLKESTRRRFRERIQFYPLFNSIFVKSNDDAVTTEQCRFMDKKVREISRFFVAPPRAFPLSV